MISLHLTTRKITLIYLTNIFCGNTPLSLKEKFTTVSEIEIPLIPWSTLDSAVESGMIFIYIYKII